MANEDPARKQIIIDPISSGSIQLGAAGINWQNLGEAMNVAKLVATAQRAIPAYLRGNVGDCLSIVLQAQAWGLDIYAVARMSYVVNDQIAYQAQLIHALLEKRANLKERIKFSFDGEGPTRRVTVTGHFEKEVEPCIYTSPMVRDITVKNSPLWKSDLDQQLSYFGVRAWGRRYAPEVIMGIYTPDELPGDDETGRVLVGFDNARDVTPKESLTDRLSARAIKGAGFDVAKVTETIAEQRPESSAVISPAEGAPPAEASGASAGTNPTEEKSNAASKGRRNRPGGLLPSDGEAGGEGSGSEVQSGGVSSTNTDYITVR